MTKFIYFSRLDVARFDPYCQSPRYQHSDWFNISLPGCNHITSRVKKLDVPWDLHNSLFPIPINSTTTDSFSQSIEAVAERFCNYVMASSVTPYLYWSGGIDSTSILVSLLKVAGTDFLDRLTILHDNHSIEENAYFYHYYIDQKLKTESITNFKITENNYKNIIVVDGEGGNQCVGGHTIHQMCQLQQIKLLNRPWGNVDFNSMPFKVSTFNLELIKESIKLAPVEINTLYDFIWWSNFNFKFDDAMIRKMFVYGKQLSNTQRQQFWKSGLYRFYAQPELQSWSLSNLHQLRESISQDPKYIAKKYIYNFDHNQLWFAYKKEQASVPSMFDLQRLPIIGITDDWNTISIADDSTRQMIKQLLYR